VSLGWSQHELGRRAGLSQSEISRFEHGLLTDLTIETAERLLGAMGARLVTTVDAPFLGDRTRQLEPAHARCSAHVVSRLRRSGWLTASEVEIGGDRSRGWIDVLAIHPETGLLLVIEIKTEIRDLGAIERSLGWYERAAWTAARRLGWHPARSTGCRLLLATRANDQRVVENREAFAAGFPLRVGSRRVS
jgi:transcriptional regulator with XRE-family HTH domain